MAIHVSEVLSTDARRQETPAAPGWSFKKSAAREYFLSLRPLYVTVKG